MEHKTSHIKRRCFCSELIWCHRKSLKFILSSLSSYMKLSLPFKS
jgi:hypothetical protein